MQKEGGIKAGDTLLMNVGTSGLASIIIPMAKAFGVRVITSVLTKEIAYSIKYLITNDNVIAAGSPIVLWVKHSGVAHLRLTHMTFFR